MKTRLILSLLLIAAAGSLAAAGQGSSAGTFTETQLAVLPVEALSADEKTGLLLMREEEKLARDVYLELYRIWNLRTFSNIASSEQSHMDEVALLLERYGLEDPALSTPGKFTDPELQNLYEQLIARGSRSLREAVQVGIDIEELDIRDLERLMKTTDNRDISLVYGNLLRGSENHLAAFRRQL